MDNRRSSGRDPMARRPQSGPLRPNGKAHGVVECAASVIAAVPLTAQFLVFPPELPFGARVDTSHFGTIVVTLEKGRKGNLHEPVTKCDGSRLGGGSENGISNSDGHGGLFDNLGPKPSKSIRDLRLFHEICTEIDNGATSLRQVGERFNERRRKHDYPLDLPRGITGASRGVKAALELFQQLFGLEEQPRIFTYDPSNSNAVNGLTDFGRSLSRHTQSFLMSHGIIKKPLDNSPR